MVTLKQALGGALLSHSPSDLSRWGPFTGGNGDVEIPADPPYVFPAERGEEGR